MLCDPVNHYLGRRGTIFFTGLFCVFPGQFSPLTNHSPYTDGSPRSSLYPKLVGIVHLSMFTWFWNGNEDHYYPYYDC
jgi:hypothetical protein